MVARFRAVNLFSAIIVGYVLAGGDSSMFIGVCAFACVVIGIEGAARAEVLEHGSNR